MSKTSIEWTDQVWNPVRGCSRVSEGCRNCYAERIALRFSSNGRLHRVKNEGKPGPFHGFVQITNGHPQWTGKVELVEKHLEDPMRWRKPQRVFVNSMSDLWHEKLQRVQIARTYAVMAYCQWHMFQILTKRPEVRLAYGDLENDVRILLQALLKKHGPPPHPKPFRWPLPNVWEGVSVEDQKTADERIPLLLETPAAVPFVSYEPALGPVDFGSFAPFSWQPIDRQTQDELRRMYPKGLPPNSLNAELGKQKLDWIIVGGESGPGARPMHPAWVRSAREQCQAAGVAFFFKQWGAWVPHEKAAHHGVNNGAGVYVLPNGQCGSQNDYWEGKAAGMNRVGKKAAGAMLDGREWREFPEAHAEAAL